MAEKVTTMVLKVDLQCSQCYKKIKKILCKFPLRSSVDLSVGVDTYWLSFLKYEPELFYVIVKFRTREIRNQVYDEKGNTVTVTVVCCSPEKCRDKLCSKGGKVIKSIAIKKPANPGKPDKKETGIAEVPEKSKVTVDDKPKKEDSKPKVVVVDPKPDGGKPQDKPKQAPKEKGPEPAAKPPPPESVKLPATNPVNGIPPAMACYGPSYDGFGGGAPWYNVYGIPPPPPPQPIYDGYYGYSYGYPYGRESNFNRCDAYFSEENPSVCSIM